MIVQNNNNTRKNHYGILVRWKHSSAFFRHICIRYINAGTEMFFRKFEMCCLSAFYGCVAYTLCIISSGEKNIHTRYVGCKRCITCHEVHMFCVTRREFKRVSTYPSKKLNNLRAPKFNVLRSWLSEIELLLPFIKCTLLPFKIFAFMRRRRRRRQREATNAFE